MQNLLRDLGPGRITAMIVVSLGMLGMFVFLGLRLSSPNMVPLYSDLSPEDSTHVIGQLSTTGIEYKLQNGGSQVLVPADQVPMLRVRMATEGLPSKGAIVGYEIFDKSEMMGSSHFVQNVNLVRALEGELSRTLAGFSKVSTARVHIVLPKRELFSKTPQEPSASVMLKIKGGQTLEKNEVAAMSHLVASAVPGLTVQKVTIVDVKGNPLKLASDEKDDPGMIAATSEQFRIQFQNNIKQKIESLLERSLGAGKVVAQVAAEIDFDRTVTNSETYDPDGQVARSVQAVEEREGSASPAAEVAAQNNIPGNNAAAGATAGSSTERTNQTTNYEISKTVKNHISETGSVKKLSVAVLVDGRYEAVEGEDAPAYKPRSDEERKQIESLVKSAIGFQSERGDKVEIVNMQFWREDASPGIESPMMSWLTQDLGGIIQTLVIGGVVTLVILLVIKPMVSRAFEITKSENDEAELQAALAGMGDIKTITNDIDATTGNAQSSESAIDIERFEEKMKSSSLGTINEIVERHPEETMSIIRNWLGQES